MTAETGSRVHITVRYFGAACAAAGSESDQLTVRPGATVGELVEGLGGRSQELARVLLPVLLSLRRYGRAGPGPAAAGGQHDRRTAPVCRRITRRPSLPRVKNSGSGA